MHNILTRREENHMVRFERFVAQPIPPERSIVDWKKQALRECGEPLVALSSSKYACILTSPEYFQKKIPGAVEKIYLRESVAHKLVAVAEDLPDKYCLLVWDGWRPLAVQQALFDAYFQVVRAQYPTLPEQEVCRRTEVYVSLPNQSAFCPSPHYTGGAIDLTLADTAGNALFMGTEFDASDATARTRFLEERRAQGERLSEAEEMALRHRRLLYHSMLAHGFTNYAEEWWHFDYGNQFWGTITRQSAFYGPVEP